MAKDSIVALSDGEQARISAILESAGPVQAVRHVQELTGASLAQSKHLVDRIHAGETLPRPDQQGEVEDRLADDARAALRTDGAPAAIKLVQRQTGMSLGAAQAFVQRLG